MGMRAQDRYRWVYLLVLVLALVLVVIVVGPSRFRPALALPCMCICKPPLVLLGLALRPLAAACLLAAADSLWAEWWAVAAWAVAAVGMPVTS